MKKIPSALGVVDGKLQPCPSRPNCVCSCASDPRHAISPISYAGESHEALARLQQIVLKFPRAKLMQATDDYLHFQFVSAILRFTDDVEFLVDKPNFVIQVRSASRVGFFDLGVNRQRIKRLTAAFKAT